MKKIFYLASIAALAFSSCAKDNTTEAQIDAVTGGAKITAAMAADDTRTSLEKVDGKYEFRWSAGDQLGVYGIGANTLNNAAFVLENASDGKAVGVFASQNVELKADQDYVAVYPRFQTSLFSNIDLKEVELDVPGTKGEEQDDYVDLTAVKVTIPAKQKYQNGTFYTQTVPAVSSEFFVNADGGANLSMQPVVDYLFVNIQSTEPIKTLKLQLNDNKAKKMLKLAGTAALTRYEFGDNFRYYVNQKNLQDDAIILETDESYATVACHEANTYVFAIPGGILGMGGDIEALITVNDDTNYTFKAVGDRTPDGKTIESNKGINFGGAKFDVVRKKDGDAVLPYENTIFWMNSISVDTDGDKKADARGSFVYNPNGDAIISNEVELLEYIYKYNAGTKVDAFLCEDGSFDFSIKNMMELATEYKNTKYEGYIADYLADVNKGGGFPCFNNYTNNFIGNGAVIENIEQPLLNPKGIFGGNVWYGPRDAKNWEFSDITTRGGEFVETKDGQASITNITFANIVAGTFEQSAENIIVPSLAGNITADVEFSGRGYILAAQFDGTIKNVTVKNADGEAIMGDMSVEHFNALKIEGVSKLANIADYLNVEANLDMTKSWANVAGVKESIFQYILPKKNAKTKTDAIHEITIAKGDASTYAKLTDEVLADKTASAVAVVIEGVSYWTGDTFAVNKDVKNCVNKNATPKVYYVRYAEELAGGNGEHVKLARSIDLNYYNLITPFEWGANDIPTTLPGQHYDPVLGAILVYEVAWDMVEFASLDGGNFSVSNFVMYANNENVAPFDAPVVKDITLNNVYIDVATDDPEVEAVVPEYIAGLTLGGENVNGQTVITNATVNGLVIDAYRDDDTNNTEANYSNQYVVKIGWLVAEAQNAQITNAKVNGVESTVKGIAGLVAKNVIDDSSKFVKAEVSNVEAVNTALANFAKFDGTKKNYNVMGTAVGLVENNARRMVDIKFMQCGEPVFLYNAPSTLTVIYNETEKGSFHN